MQKIEVNTSEAQARELLIRQAQARATKVARRQMSDQKEFRPVRDVELDKNTATATMDEALQAMQSFDGDLGIVKHNDHPRTSPNEVNEAGTYTLTRFDEESLQSQAEKAKLVVVTCMDARGAKATVKAAMQLHNISDMNKVFVISVGGGLVQYQVLHIGDTGKSNSQKLGRDKSMRTILAWLGTFENIENFVLTGHDCTCGACKYANSNIGVDQVVGSAKGSPEEQAAMMMELLKSWSNIVPDSVKSRAKLFLAHFNQAKEGKDKFDQLLPINTALDPETNTMPVLISVEPVPGARKTILMDKAPVGP